MVQIVLNHRETTKCLRDLLTWNVIKFPLPNMELTEKKTKISCNFLIYYSLAANTINGVGDQTKSVRVGISSIGHMKLL